MGSEAKRDKVEIPIACDLTALDAGQRERRRALQERLRADVREIREIENGYAFEYSPELEVLLAVAEFVALERLCCPFFDFAIEVGREGGPLWLRMTGSEGAKEVLRAEIGG
jgi:hypothetical protein